MKNEEKFLVLSVVLLSTATILGILGYAKNDMLLLIPDLFLSVIGFVTSCISIKIRNKSLTYEKI